MQLIVKDNQRNRNIPLDLEKKLSCVFYEFYYPNFILVATLCDHVKLFSADRPSDADAVSNAETLFRDIEQSREQSRRLIRTHECIQSLGMTGYVKNILFDAEECMTYLLNLFYL